MKIIIYHSSIIRIGGVETLTYNFCKLLSKYYDITLLYRECDPYQLFRLQQLVKCEKYDPFKKYECETCIVVSSWNGYPDSVVSTKNKYIQIIHANYKEMLKYGYAYTPWKKTTEHLAVSNTIRDIFNNMHKLNATTMYNLLDDIKVGKPVDDNGDYELKLVSATRLTKEKGYNRMVKLANSLKQKGVKFKWYIFTDLDTYKIKVMKMPEIVYMRPTYDIFEYIKWADYLVQLSDTEGYCYAINESLQYGTPVICTDFESVHESVIDSFNGYILDMELNNLDMNKIINEKLKGFVYKPLCTIKDWFKVLGEQDKDYVYEEITTVKLKSLKTYADTYFERTVKSGEIIEVSPERAEVLLEHKYAKII